MLYELCLPLFLNINKIVLFNICSYSLLKHLTVFCGRLHREVFGSFARAKFPQEKPAMMECQSLEPHGLPSPKAHLCAYGYTI